MTGGARVRVRGAAAHAKQKRDFARENPHPRYVPSHDLSRKTGRGKKD